MGTNTGLIDFAGATTARKLSESWMKSWVGGLPKVSQTRTVRMLRVTAVLLADDDGGRATGVQIGRRVRPADGLLRNPAIHTSFGANHIDDWISLANKQLFVSGADFLLDRKNVRYVLVRNTAANSMTCDVGGQAALDLIADRKKARGDNPWRDSVLLLFPWGNHATQASEQGCSDVASPFIKMAASFHDFDVLPRFVDGLPVPGNNLLTHELGHFLGLSHNFPEELHHLLRGSVLDENLNPLGLPLTEENLAQFNGLTKADIAKIRKQGKHWIATWKYSLESDAFNGNPDLFPASLAVGDTPVNLGMGLPAMMGDAVGSGNQTYDLERYSGAAMKTTEESSFGTPRAKAKPGIEQVLLDNDVRLNVMGYWYSNVFGQKFSKGQVARMQHAVDTVRASMVDRTVKVTVTVTPTGIDVTDALFAPPPLVLQAPEDVRLQIRKPTARQVEAALDRIRNRPLTLARRAPAGNHCAVRTKAEERA